jgi:hypothetical protein
MVLTVMAIIGMGTSLRSLNYQDDRRNAMPELHIFSLGRNGRNEGADQAPRSLAMCS